MPNDNDITGRMPMTCEEFAMACPEVRSASDDNTLRQAVLAHARQCPRCAALQSNLQTLQDDLRYLGLETKDADAPPRVQMRVMQEFRTKHKTMKARRIAWIGSWGLATAALVAAAASWISWRHDHNLIGRPGTGSAEVAQSATNQAPAGQSTEGLVLGDTFVASNSSGDFTLLPGSTPSPMEDATVVRVQMQRGALGALGFTVNEEHAADLIQVDLLVGDDGLPQAVRLPEATE